jgi:hypothetical protein
VASTAISPWRLPSSLEVTHDLPLTVDALRHADRNTGDVNSVKVNRRQYQPWLGLAAVWPFHDVARLLIAKYGLRRHREGNRGTYRRSRTNAKRSSGVVYRPDDLPRWVDTVCLRGRTAGTSTVVKVPPESKKP